ncbi:MAG: MFS transporter [Ardenticatenaceae bacterium]|nr:MFS transporter [Ardenticatenaceae bacterium]
MMQTTAVSHQTTSPSRRKEIWGWYLYDFGNSAYAAVVLLAVYSAYFQGTVVGGAEGSRLWGISVGIAMLVVAIISPVLGSIADFSGSKKRFLFLFTAIACVFTATLFFVQAGDVVLGMTLFIMAEIGYRASQVYYNGLLPEIARPAEMGRISGNGWAIGSAGGIVCLLIVLPLIVIVGGGFVVRLSLLITAVFFALSAVPIFLWLREKAQPQPLPPGSNIVTIGFQRLWRTVKKARHYREFIKFMIAFLIFNDGIIMALDFAAIIGTVLFGMEQQGLIIFIIIVQITSVIGAYVFGIATDRWSGKRALIISLLLMIAAVIWLFFATSQPIFFVIGALAGFALTGVQSVSRTMVGKLSPPGQSAEFYGLFAVAGRTSSFIGPTLYGIFAAEIALLYAKQGETAVTAEQLGQRAAILTIAAFLIVGLVLLLWVNEKRGIEAAHGGLEIGD